MADHDLLPVSVADSHYGNRQQHRGYNQYRAVYSRWRRFPFMTLLIHFLRFLHGFLFPPSISSQSQLASSHNFSPFFQLDVLWAHSVTPPLVRIVLDWGPIRSSIRGQFAVYALGGIRTNA